MKAKQGIKAYVAPLLPSTIIAVYVIAVLLVSYFTGYQLSPFFVTTLLVFVVFLVILMFCAISSLFLELYSQEVMRRDDEWVFVEAKEVPNVPCPNFLPIQTIQGSTSPVETVETEETETSIGEKQKQFTKRYVLEGFRNEPIWSMINDVLHEDLGIGGQAIITFHAAIDMGWISKVPTHRDATFYWGEIVGQKSNYYDQRNQYTPRNKDKSEALRIAKGSLMQKWKNCHETSLSQ